LRWCQKIGPERDRLWFGGTIKNAYWWKKLKDYKRLMKIVTIKRYGSRVFKQYIVLIKVKDKGVIPTP